MIVLEMKCPQLLELLLDKHSKLSTRDRRDDEIECETGLTSEFYHLEALIYYDRVAL